MRCEDVLTQLNAQNDGKSLTEVSNALTDHLAACARCRAEAEALKSIDTELRQAFAPRRTAATQIAQVVMNELRHETTTAETPRPATALARLELRWGELVVGVAAGFLLAMMVFQPWQSPKSGIVAMTSPVARVALASGPIEVEWADKLAVFTCPPSAPLEKQSTIRTGPDARCEIDLQDGNAMRLDCNTEVKLRDAEVVEVSQGRIWSCAQPGSKGVKVQSASGTVLPKGAGEFAVSCQSEELRVTVVAGTVDVRTSEESVEVGPRQQVRINEGKIERDAQVSDVALETAWVNSIVALRGADHPELAERVNDLLAKIGAAKLSLLYEDELRRLGDTGVPPLLAFVDSTRATPNLGSRATAIRLVADMAESRRIPELIALLADANPEVRVHAARGLERLTGRDQGCDAKSWQTQSWAACEPAHQKWVEWWAANRDRYPTARREIPAPPADPF